MILKTHVLKPSGLRALCGKPPKFRVTSPDVLPTCRICRAAVVKAQRTRELRDILGEKDAV